jgi:hypothetical protein
MSICIRHFFYIVVRILRQGKITPNNNENSSGTLHDLLRSQYVLRNSKQNDIIFTESIYALYINLDLWTVT